MPRFDAQSLLKSLEQWPVPGKYWIAYSGGADSAALLYAMVGVKDQLKASVAAIHINHGLHEKANEWQNLCEAQCATLGISLTCKSVELTKQPRDSFEAQARNARYAAMKSAMQAGDMLLTAHHADDQAETLLLHLVRGAGLDGLSGIRPIHKQGDYWIARPFLATRRSELQQFLADQNGQSAEDPSNEDCSIRRNYMRHKVLPLLMQQWPAAIENLGRTAGHVQRASDLLNSAADTDLAHCNAEHANILDVERLCALDSERQALTIRQWARQNKLPLPEQRHLTELLRQLHDSDPESAFCVSWPGVDIRRYRGQLYIDTAMSPEPPLYEYEWDGRQPLQLPASVGSLQFDGKYPGSALHVQNRSGSEQLKITAQKHHRTLKHLFQQSAVPPWLRAHIPILFRNDQCLAAGDLWVDTTFASELAEFGVRLEWQPGLPLWRTVGKRISTQK